MTKKIIFRELPKRRIIKGLKRYGYIKLNNEQSRLDLKLICYIQTKDKKSKIIKHIMDDTEKVLLKYGFYCANLHHFLRCHYHGKSYLTFKPRSPPSKA